MAGRDKAVDVATDTLVDTLEGTVGSAQFLKTAGTPKDASDPVKPGKYALFERFESYLKGELGPRTGTPTAEQEKTLKRLEYTPREALFGFILNQEEELSFLRSQLRETGNMLESLRISIATAREYIDDLRGQTSSLRDELAFERKQVDRLEEEVGGWEVSEGKLQRKLKKAEEEDKRLRAVIEGQGRDLATYLRDNTELVKRNQAVMEWFDSKDDLDVLYDLLWPGGRK